MGSFGSQLGRLFTAIRGGVTEATEAAADSQALRILDQQLRDGRADLEKAQFELAGLMGRAKLARDKLATMEAKRERDFATGKAAVEQGREDLGRELANRIAEQDGDIARERALVTAMTEQEARLRDAVMNIRQRITGMEREVETVKVTASVQKAQSAIVASGSGAASTLNSAAASLQRIKERQAQTDAHFAAADQLSNMSSGGDLDRRLAEAGLLEGPGSGASIFDSFKRGAPALAAPQPSAGALPAPNPGSSDQQR
jgi:phage shock protein A